MEIIYARHTGFDKFRALGSLQFFLEHSLDENIIIIIIIIIIHGPLWAKFKPDVLNPFFLICRVYLAGVQCTSFSNFILRLYFAFWFQINQYFRM